MNAATEPPGRAAEAGTNAGADAVQRWRLVLRREPLPPDLAQRDQAAQWESALASSGLPVAGLDALRPKARLAIAAPLPAGIAGEAELADLWLTQRLPRWRVREALADRLPAGFGLVEIFDVWLGEPALAGRVGASIYRATFPAGSDVAAMTGAAASLLAAGSLPRERRRGETTIAYDLRPFLAGLSVEGLPEGGAIVRMTLRHDAAKGIGRPEETVAALTEAMGGSAVAPVSLVREGLVLTDPSAEPAPSRPARRPPPRDGGPGPRSRAGTGR